MTLSQHGRPTAECLQSASFFMRLRSSQSGNSLLETALSLSVLLSVMTCLMSFSLLLYAKHFAASAARLGARYAIVRGSTYTGISCGSQTFNCAASATDIANFIGNNVPLGLSASATAVQVYWPGLATSGLSCITLTGTNSPGCTVQVVVTYKLATNLPLLPSFLNSFQSSSTMMIEQ